jgi:hypothetical protein
MYCKYCGEKNEETNNFCKSCGSKLKEERVVNNNANNAKIISIIGLIFCFIPFLSVVGLVLSIIGLLINNKLKKENGVKPSYRVLNIIGIVVSVLDLILSIIVLVYTIISLNSKPYVGKWDCTSYSSFYSSYSIEVEFKDNKTFSWGQYGDVSNNGFLGTYTASKEDSNENDEIYNLKLKINSYTLNGENQTDLSNVETDLDTEMYITDDSSIIKINTTDSSFYCKKVSEN